MNLRVVLRYQHGVVSAFRLPSDPFRIRLLAEAFSKLTSAATRKHCRSDLVLVSRNLASLSGPSVAGPVWNPSAGQVHLFSCDRPTWKRSRPSCRDPMTSVPGSRCGGPSPHSRQVVGEYLLVLHPWAMSPSSDRRKFPRAGWGNLGTSARLRASIGSDPHRPGYALQFRRIQRGVSKFDESGGGDLGPAAGCGPPRSSRVAHPWSSSPFSHAGLPATCSQADAFATSSPVAFRNYRSTTTNSSLHSGPRSRPFHCLHCVSMIATRWRTASP